MQTVRARLGPALEWIVAALFLLATVAVTSMIVRELRAPRAAAAGSPRPAAEAALMPAVLPAGVVSVPLLPVGDSAEIRIGDSLDRVAVTLGRAAESGRQYVDRGALGERLTRFYERDGTRFILVFEPFERNGAARVAAIYLP